MQNNNVMKALGRINFIKMLLSVNSDPVETKFTSVCDSGKRMVTFTVSFSVDEEYYQLCLDLSLQNLLNSR